MNRLFALLLLTALFGIGCNVEQPTESPAPEAGAESADSAAYPMEYAKWETMRPGEQRRYNQRASLIQRGRGVYTTYCVGCHGEQGDGKGPAAIRLQTQPRDFTSGIYKFRSTDSGHLPMEADLYRTISRGLSQVSMPAFPFMPERDKLAVIEYIKTMYPKWEQEKDRRRVVPIPQAPRDLADSRRVLRGRVVYVEMQCTQCHGFDGQGTGATQTEYVDAWGNRQKPFNFTRGSLKGGNDPEDIYRTFHTGLQSVMPSYGGETLASAAARSFREKSASLPPAEVELLETILGDFPDTANEVFNDMTEADRLALGQRNSWDLVAYILSLRTGTSTAAAVLGPEHVRER